MKLLVEIDVDVIDRDEFDVDVENGFDYVDYNIINEDEYWNSDFYYRFGDDVNDVINDELRDSNNIGIIKKWRIKKYEVIN
tara:strand:- start:242 stop:484 length:243 start_codon:yes stop_codon:yes gene_type:complete